LRKLEHTPTDSPVLAVSVQLSGVKQIHPAANDKGGVPHPAFIRFIRG
jgi:hypothetical protein